MTQYTSDTQIRKYVSVGIHATFNRILKYPMIVAFVNGVCINIVFV